LKPKITYANVTATMALVLAVATGGAYAARTDLITTKDIAPGAVRASDIHKNAVKSSDLSASAVGSSDIKAAAIQSSDIGEGQVEPVDITLPDSKQCLQGDQHTVQAGDAFVLVDSVCVREKTDPTSQLHVSWTGSASAGFRPCIFELRVDGQPAGNGAGQLFVANGSTLSVSATALFSSLPPGPHTIEIWARSPEGSDPIYPCTVGPVEAGISQTFVVDEIVN